SGMRGFFRECEAMTLLEQLSAILGDLGSLRVDFRIRVKIEVLHVADSMQVVTASRFLCFCVPVFL
ncbi:MAG: hypothetical protein WB573_03700, partial [Terracidiphilus sp.]